MGIHPFVIGALKDVVASAKARPRDYIKEILPELLKEQGTANPTMIDFAMPSYGPGRTAAEEEAEG
jgi:hypothetical protein